MHVPIIDSAGTTVEVDLLAGASCDGSLPPSLPPTYLTRKTAPFARVFSLVDGASSYF